MTVSLTPAETRAAKVLADILDLPTPAETRAAKVLADILDSTENIRKCSICGCGGHNSRTCSNKTTVAIKKKRICSLCSACGHNKRTCPLTWIEKEKTRETRIHKCNICGEIGHNKRTCHMKCIPCSDQVARAYCFAGMSDKMAVKIAKIMDCSSIYGETEEYPQFERVNESITLANGKTIDIDLGQK